MENKQRLSTGLLIILGLAGSASLSILLAYHSSFSDRSRPDTTATFTEAARTSSSAPIRTPTSPATSTPTLTAAVLPKVELLPAQFMITGVPFIEQAPHRNWDEIHEETCEEATMLTVAHYLAGDKAVGANQAEAELQTLVSWQQDHLGTYTDTTVAETAAVLRDYFGYGDRVQIIDDAKLTDLKQEIAAGRPVIVPAAGRLLGNPYFKQPGPIYHMVVAIGYTEDEIIVHDPGTRRGANFHYPTDQFWNAVHDFVDKTDEGMAKGAKRLIVVDAQ